jgi:hypothetical protein
LDPGVVTQWPSKRNRRLKGRLLALRGLRNVCLGGEPESSRNKAEEELKNLRREKTASVKREKDTLRMTRLDRQLKTKAQVSASSPLLSARLSRSNLRA